MTYTEVLVARIAELERERRRWRDKACRERRRAELWRHRAVKGRVRG